LSRQLAAVVGPGLGAVLVAAGGTAVAFGLDAVSYGVAAVFVLGAAGSRRRSLAPSVTPAPTKPSAVAADAPPTAAGRRSVVADLREGLATVLGTPWIWISIAIAGISNITLAGPLEAVLPLLVEEHLAGSVGTLGLLASLGALGAVAAAIALGRLRRIRRRGLLVYGAWLVLCAATVLYGLPVGLAGALVAAFVVGAANATLNLAWTSSLQDLVPGDRLGRVTAIDSVGSAALVPVGYAVAGLAADAFGPASVFVAGGLLSAVVIGTGLLHPSVRGLD
jgi:DHA3 family tetracycline resistance protein-like MFS transporter